MNGPDASAEETEAAERRKLAEFILPWQKRSLEALTPDRSLWASLLDGSIAGEGRLAEVNQALEVSTAQQDVRAASIAAAERRRLTALDSPWALDLLLPTLDRLTEALHRTGWERPRRPPLVACVFDGAVNGWAIDPGSPRHTLMVIPVGLFTFCNLAAKAIAHVPPRTEHPDGRGYGFELRPEKLRQSLDGDRVPAQRFCELVRAYMLEGHPDRAPRWLPRKSHLALHGTLLSVMELFLIGHEYGHVLLGHLDAPAPAEPGERHRLEHQADAAGLVGTARVLHAEDTDPVNALLGAHLFIRTTDIMERCLALLSGEDPAKQGEDTASHPCGAKRVAFLAHTLAPVELGEDLASAAREMCSFYDVILDDFAHTAENQAAALHRAGFQPHPVWRRGGRRPGEGAWPARAV